jgi:hypothetical protein
LFVGKNSAGNFRFVKIMAPPVPIQNHRVSWLYLCSLVLAGIAVLFLGWQWIAHRQIVAELALTQEENRRGADRLAQVKTAAAEDRKEYDRLSALIAAQAKPTPTTGWEDARAAGRLFVADHPESKELVRSAMVALAHSWPARAGRRAGFSDEQIGQWMELFARSKGAPFYGVRGVEVEFGELDSTEMEGKMLREIVGDELFARYRELHETDYGRSVTAEIANRAELAGVPLTMEQIQALAAVFGKANLNTTSEWDRSRKEAAGLLSPEQQAIFDEEAAVHRASEEEFNFRQAFLTGKK